MNSASASSRILYFATGSLLAVAIASATPAQAGANTVLTCVSTDGGRRHCEGYTDGGVALQRSVGTAHCLLGRNWGYDAEGVWVTEGCGADFVLGNPSAEEQRLAAVPVAAEAPAAPTAVPPSEGAASLDEYTFYSRFGAQAARVASETQIQDAGSRVGFAYSTGERFKFFAAAELSLVLTKNANSFNPGETTSGGFVVLDQVQGEVFGTRLGYVGIDFGNAGRVTIGKQWGVHYDIASYTDAFNVFGADASATFNAGTDGGLMGTGRADAAISYRNVFGPLEIGTQVQLRDLGNDEGMDGFGISAQIDLLPGLKVGGAFTWAQFDDALKNTLLGLDGDAEYGIFGLHYEGESLTLAATYARQRNGDLARFPFFEGDTQLQVPEVFDAEGYEFFGRYQWGRLGILGGWLNYKPDTSRPGSLLDPRAQTRYLITGLDYLLTPGSIFFTELRIADGYDQFGVPGEDVLVMGFKYKFRKTGTFRFE
jgi:predicted porin